MAPPGKASLIGDLADTIVKGLSPEKIILFGSQATGRADEDSDVDLLIVAETDQDWLERTWQVYRLLEGKRTGPLDVIVLTPREYDAMKRGGYPLIREVEEEGAVLYQRGRPRLSVSPSGRLQGLAGRPGAVAAHNSPVAPLL